ncbi:hypothetical protein SAMN05444392_11827 [Seinonella peptonophila]|uniref:Uncharacterized protein n=1 Tax=Seinonella peptonophila TaxID=112248 RepID=A0A1M5B4T1_9BACL|nr:hypothetical protein [Seinonella peptonophila]SHF37448.1 hypothetical protein SAMN05444392_11827 [Seinonella peptonophila]
MSDPTTLQNIPSLRNPKIPSAILKAIHQRDLASLVAFFQGAADYRDTTYIDYAIRSENRKFHLFHYLGAVYAAQSLDKSQETINQMIKKRPENSWDPSSFEQEEPGTQEPEKLERQTTDLHDRLKVVPTNTEQWNEFLALQVLEHTHELRELFDQTERLNQASPDIGSLSSLDRMVYSLRQATETGEIRNILPAMVSGYFCATKDAMKRQTTNHQMGQEVPSSSDLLDLKTLQSSNEDYRQYFTDGFNLGKVIQGQLNPQEITTWYRDMKQFVQKARNDLAEQIKNQLEQGLPNSYEQLGDVDSGKTLVKLNEGTTFSSIFTDYFTSQNGSIIIQKPAKRYGPPGEEYYSFKEQPKVYYQPKTNGPYYQMKIDEVVKVNPYNLSSDVERIILIDPTRPDDRRLVVRLDGDQCIYEPLATGFGKERREAKKRAKELRQEFVRSKEKHPNEIEVEPIEKWIEAQQEQSPQGSVLQLKSDKAVNLPLYGREFAGEEVLGKPKYRMGRANDGMEILFVEMESESHQGVSGVYIRQGNDGPFLQCWIDPKQPDHISTPYFEQDFIFKTNGKGIELYTPFNKLDKEFKEIPQAEFPNEVDYLAWDLHRQPDSAAPESTKLAYQQSLMGTAIANGVGTLTVEELIQIKDYLSSSLEMNLEQERQVVQKIVGNRLQDVGMIPNTQLKPEAYDYLKDHDISSVVQSALTKREPQPKEENFLVGVAMAAPDVFDEIMDNRTNKATLNKLPLQAFRKALIQSIKNHESKDIPSTPIQRTGERVI